MPIEKQNKWRCVSQYYQVKEWAVKYKAEVSETAERFGGGFLKLLVRAFVHADKINTNKMIDVWKKEFTVLYHMNKARKDKR